MVCAFYLLVLSGPINFLLSPFIEIALRILLPINDFMGIVGELHVVGIPTFSHADVYLT